MSRFIVTISIFVIALTISSIESVPSTTQRLASNGRNNVYGRGKGDSEDFAQTGTVPRWDNSKLKEEIPTHRNKGDGAALDPRGTVRYSVLPTGRISRGVITSVADDEIVLDQAKGMPCLIS